MSDQRECPYCKESIKADAVKCRYCGSRVAPTLPEHEGVCPFCKEEIKPGAIKCRYCGSVLGPSPELREAQASPPAQPDCGCGGGHERERTYPSRNIFSRTPAQSDWWKCNTYCFLYTLGEDFSEWDKCVSYVCGDYPVPPDIRV